MKSYLKTILRKDYLLFKKYKLQMVLTYFSIFLYLFALYNISKAIQPNNEATDLFLKNPFIFLLTGYMVIDLTITIINVLSAQITFYQTSGMIEEIISIDRLNLFFLSSYFFPCILWFFRNIFYILISYVFFDLQIVLNLGLVEIFTIFLLLILYTFILLGVSFLACSLTIIFKKGNPIIIIFIASTTILSGALYPTDVLPTALQHIAEFIPAYELLTIIRGTIFNSFSNEYIFGLTKLIIYAPLFFFVGLILINYSIRYIKKTGKGYTY